MGTIRFFMACPQRLLMLLDLIDTHNYLYGNHGDDVPNVILWLKTDQHYIRSVVQGGGPTINAGSGVIVQRALDHWRSCGATGIDTVDDTL